MQLRIAALACTFLLACEARPETIRGVTEQIDASREDGASPAIDAGGEPFGGCTSDADCLARLAPNAPSGTLYAICFGGSCRSADSCVETHLGVPDSCTCGDGSLSPYGCYGFTLCVRAENESAPRCVPACTSP